MSLMFSAFTAQAEIAFSPAISYWKETVESDGVKAESERTALDLRLGYVHASGLFLGGMYSMTSIDDDDLFAGGPTLGFNHKNGFYALFTYFLASEYKYESGTKLTDGMGPQIDIGWIFPLTSVFYIGPQISYRSLSYEKAEASGVSADADVTITNTSPYLTLWFKF
jgi:hypothetical protein